MAQKSDKEEYCGQRFIPVKDCIYNQLDECDREERECSFGIFDYDEASKFDAGKGLRKEITADILKEKVEQFPKYKNCYNCRDFQNSKWGTVWYKKKDVGNPLNLDQALKETDKFFSKKHKRFRISTHSNDTLSVDEINNILDTWEKEDGFIADVIIIDYADLLTSTIQDVRQQQNSNWKKSRAISQKRHSLLITVTQADAAAYEKDTLSLKNFSEDKRKYAHVTAMFGMNQDPSGRERKLGIMRLNSMVMREGEPHPNEQVTVLQNLSAGQICIGSYW